MIERCKLVVRRLPPSLPVSCGSLHGAALEPFRFSACSMFCLLAGGVVSRDSGRVDRSRRLVQLRAGQGQVRPTACRSSRLCCSARNHSLCSTCRDLLWNSGLTGSPNSIPAMPVGGAAPRSCCTRVRTCGSRTSPTCRASRPPGTATPLSASAARSSGAPLAGRGAERGRLRCSSRGLCLPGPSCDRCAISCAMHHPAACCHGWPFAACRCQVEYAPFQKVPRQRVKRDPKEGTIERGEAPGALPA